MGKSRRLTEIEDPDHEEVESVQASAQTAVWFQRNIYPERSRLSCELHLLSKTTAHFHQGNPPEVSLSLPGAPASPNDIIPPILPRLPTQPHLQPPTRRRASDCLCSVARVLVILDRL